MAAQLVLKEFIWMKPKSRVYLECTLQLLLFDFAMWVVPSTAGTQSVVSKVLFTGRCWLWCGGHRQRRHNQSRLRHCLWCPPLQSLPQSRKKVWSGPTWLHANPCLVRSDPKHPNIQERQAGRTHHLVCIWDKRLQPRKSSGHCYSHTTPLRRHCCSCSGVSGCRFWHCQHFQWLSQHFYNCKHSTTNHLWS